MKELSNAEIDELFDWLDTVEISRINKRLNRDFSDAVPLAQILKKIYPKLVEIHNYPTRSSIALKYDNWQTLNRKVLKKLHLPQSNEILNKLANGIPGIIENVLYKIMLKVKLDDENDLFNINNNNNNNVNNLSVASSDNNLNGEIVMVQIEKLSDDGHMEKINQKMILYSVYEIAERTIQEKNQIISMLDQKIMHMENMLKLKSERINELNCQLAKKSSKLLIDHHNNIITVKDLFKSELNYNNNNKKDNNSLIQI